jgi:hypothetical protein
VSQDAPPTWLTLPYLGGPKIAATISPQDETHPFPCVGVTTYDASTMGATTILESQHARSGVRAEAGQVIAAFGVAIGVGAFVGSALVALRWAGDQFPWWNDSVFNWTLSILGIVGGCVALGAASCLVAFVFISLGARMADPTGERFERFWGLNRRERLFASEELRRFIANEAEVTTDAVRNAMLARSLVSTPSQPRQDLESPTRSLSTPDTSST